MKSDVALRIKRLLSGKNPGGYSSYSNSTTVYNKILD